MQLFKKKIHCPYCNQELEKTPKRKTKCPHCDQPIIVRKGELKTQEEAEILDWLTRLEGFGLTGKRFDQERDMLSKRFKTKAPVNDTIWSFLNSWVVAHGISQETKQGYYEMARLVNLEGKDDRPYIEQALRSQLQYYKATGVKRVWVSNYGGRNDDPSTCPTCAELHGKSFQIDDAISKIPIPRSCTSDECRCEYLDYDLAKDWMKDKIL